MSYENFVSCWLLCLKFQLCGTDIYESPFVASYWLYLSLHFLHIIRNDLSSRPRFKATLHFHPVYLLPCRPERIIAGCLQSPLYLRLRLLLYSTPASGLIYRLPALICNQGISLPPPVPFIVCVLLVFFLILNSPLCRNAGNTCTLCFIGDI